LFITKATNKGDYNKQPKTLVIVKESREGNS